MSWRNTAKSESDTINHKLFAPTGQLTAVPINGKTGIVFLEKTTL